MNACVAAPVGVLPQEKGTTVTVSQAVDSCFLNIIQDALLWLT